MLIISLHMDAKCKQSDITNVWAKLSIKEDKIIEHTTTKYGHRDTKPQAQVLILALARCVYLYKRDPLSRIVCTCYNTKCTHQPRSIF